MRFLDAHFPADAPALIEAAFEQPNSVWFGFVMCEADACEVVLELSLLNGGVTLPRPSEERLELVRGHLQVCAPFVAERLSKITVFDVVPLGE